jgi:hypothetical protein
MALEMAQGNESRFAVVEAGIFERDARPGEHGVCIIKAEAVLGQVLLALCLVPFIHGHRLSYNYKCSYKIYVWQEQEENNPALWMNKSSQK